MLYELKLSKALRAAILNYYFNQSRATVRKWDKQADLEAISAVSGKYTFSAAAGTMWFSYETDKYYVTYSTNGKLFPSFTKERRPK